MGYSNGNFDFNFGNLYEGFSEAMRKFKDKMEEVTPEVKEFWANNGPKCGTEWAREDFGRQTWHGYPPHNIYKNADGAIVLEFALAGYPEDATKIAFLGDYLILQARYPEDDDTNSKNYTRRGFRPRDIQRQKYLVPAEEYEQSKAKAVFKNGVLTVKVPAKDFPDDGVRIEIVKEGN